MPKTTLSGGWPSPATFALHLHTCHQYTHTYKSHIHTDKYHTGMLRTHCRYYVGFSAASWGGFGCSYTATQLHCYTHKSPLTLPKVQIKITILTITCNDTPSCPFVLLICVGPRGGLDPLLPLGWGAGAAVADNGLGQALCHGDGGKAMAFLKERASFSYDHPAPWALSVQLQCRWVGRHRTSWAQKNTPPL